VTPESQFKTEWDRADAADARTYVSTHPRFALWGSALPGTPAGASLADVVLAAVSGYAAATGQDAAAPWIDHTPNNLRFAATLVRRFDDVRFVHVVRDGRAIARSLLSLDWGPSTPAAAGRFWAAEVGVALAAEAYLGERCMRVRYEDLVGDPDGVVDAVGAWAGLDPADTAAEVRMPDYYTERYHGLLHGAVDPARATAWRETMPRREVELVEFASGELLTFLGYEPEFGATARPPTSSERVRAAAKELTTDAIVNRVRWRRSIREAAKPPGPRTTGGET
jgi:hypothetical protein